MPLVASVTYEPGHVLHHPEDADIDPLEHPEGPDHVLQGDFLGGGYDQSPGQGSALDQRELGIADDQLNVNGGAIALGHPLGCTGAKLSATLLHELRRRGGGLGVVSMCIGGGMGAAGLFEVSG